MQIDDSLLTCHGTIVVVEERSGGLRHVGLLRCGAGLRVGDLRGLEVRQVPDGVGVALWGSGGFVTAELNGSMRGGTEAARAWEIFLPVSAAEIEVLRFVLTQAWRVVATGRIVRPRQIGFSTEFRFHFGETCLDLRTCLPVARFASCEKIMLRSGEVYAVPAEAHDAPVRPPVVWIEPLGSAGNRALQYLAAQFIADLVPGATVENVRLPEWAVVRPQPAPEMQDAVRMGRDRYWIDAPGLADCLRRGVVESVVMDGFPFNCAQYPEVGVARRLLGATVGGEDAAGFADDELVCSVRGAEILLAAHEDYILLPAAYYALLAQISGLGLVFFGQIGDDIYTQSLRAAFPRARFVQGRDPGYDFDMLRRSRNIAPSVSTFAWLAAWLSEAERVFLPVGGLFNPVQHPGQMHVPLDDARYVFVLLPYSKAVDVRAAPERFWAQQASLGAGARLVGRQEMAAICARAALLAPRAAHVGGFDAAYYVARYPDAARAAYGGRQSALEHYIQIGFGERRRAVDFDRNAYCAAYPDAAMAVAEGRFADPLQHYMAVGWALGYAPRPGVG